jgi:hypothetical protein
VTKNIGKAQQIHVLALAKRLAQPSPAPMRGFSQTGLAKEESSIADYVSRVDLDIRSVNPVTDTESRMNVRFGSLAGLSDDISLMSAFGGTADV